jgi:hypothetical protein
MSDADTQRSVGQLLQRVKVLEQLSDDRERIAVIEQINAEAGAVQARLHELEQRFTEFWRDVQSKSAPAEVLSKLDDVLVITSEMSQKHQATALRAFERIQLLEERADEHARLFVAAAEQATAQGARLDSLSESIPARVTAFTSAVEGLRGTLYEQGAQLSKVAGMLEPEPPDMDRSDDPAVIASAALRRAIINYWLNDTGTQNDVLDATAALALALDPETFTTMQELRHIGPGKGGG